jgi:iron(II)-dependent oxidoreductase
MDRRLANLWNTPQGTTSVSSYPEGGSVNGVYDLVGNVWEWTYSPFDALAPARLQWDTDVPLKSIRGGAFDTYFDTQAASDFASGEDPFARRHNIGFRCAISLSELRLTDARETASLHACTRDTTPFPSYPHPEAAQ